MLDRSVRVVQRWAVMLGEQPRDQLAAATDADLGRACGGAVDSIDAGFAMFAVGVTPDTAAMRAVRTAVTAAQHAMAPWSSGGCYVNFAESRKSGAALFGATGYEQLRAVKAIYDPADLIRSNHPIPPAA